MATNYSWGQHRLLLQQYVGNGVSPDTVDHAIRAAYSLILSQMDWKGIEASGVLQTSAAYNTGQITLTAGSPAVTGTGTSWSAAYGGWQLFLGTGPVYTVTIVDSTHLTLDRPFEGTSGGTYWLAQAYYNLPDNCRELRSIGSPVTSRELDPIDEDIFGELEGSFLAINGPASNYIMQPNSVDTQTGATVQSVLLYPVPTLAQGYPIKYDTVGEGFDGTNTADGPASFVSDAALQARAKYELKADPAELAKYNEHLRGMIHIENGKHPKQRMRPDASYTDHRIQRYLRSGGPAIVRNNLFFDADQGLATGAGTSITDSFTGNGTQALFTLTQVPVSPVVILVNNTLQILGTNYVAAGKNVNFLVGSIPANGANVKAIYTY